MGMWIALLVSMSMLGILVVYVDTALMRQEQQMAATRLVATFEASLHNAMLQRDLRGLEHIIDTLGRAQGIARVQLLNPKGDVRYASQPTLIGQTRPELCGSTPCKDRAEQQAVWHETPSGNALEVSHRIVNQVQCIQCHGTPEAHPVNGVLVIRFTPVQAHFWDGATPMLIGVGSLALCVFGALMAWTLRREVTRPLSQMAEMTDAIAKGDFSKRLQIVRHDELGHVSQELNEMARQLHDLIAQLTAHQDFLQKLLDAMPDPVLVIAADWRIQWANKAYCDLIGKAAEEVHMQHCYQVGRGLSEPCPATLVTCPVVERCLHGEGIRTIMSLRHKDGHEVPVEIDSTKLVVNGAVLTVEVLRPLEQTIRFSQEQRLSTIGLLANGVAHEIHNPLASIRIALQASLRGIRKGNIASEDLVNYLELVDVEIDRCVLATQRLMQMSAPADEGLGAVEIQRAIDDVLALLSEEAKVRDVVVHVAIKPKNLAVMANDAELRQVFVNLVQNAMNAMPSGGRIEIQTALVKAGHVSIRVSDTGSGISKDNLPRIFLPFFSRRIDGSRGMGLGLAICKVIVERFGGSIEANNQLGGGAVFTLTLPQAMSDEV